MLTLLRVDLVSLLRITHLEVCDRMAKVPSGDTIPYALGLCLHASTLRAEMNRIRYLQSSLVDGRYSADLRIRASFDREICSVCLRERLLFTPSKLILQLG